MNEFISKVGNKSSTEPELREAARAFLEATGRAGVPEKQEALSALSQHLNVNDPPRVNVVALVCGALIEAGCDPAPVAEPVIDGLRALLESSVRLADACEARMPANKNPEDDQEKVFNRVRNELAGKMPAESDAWEILEGFWPVTIAMFSTSAELRARARPLRDLVAKISTRHVAGHWLRFMLSVLDNEPILVLEPDSRLGILGRISGVVDNFQLHVLLMDVFPRPGLFARRRISQTAVDVARGIGPQASDEHIVGAWNLYTWKALITDRTLPGTKSWGDEKNWIWNEGVPDDIPAFEGRRAVLLGPPSYSRGWNAQRLFNKLPARLDVECVLKKDETQAWIERMRAKPVG